jgi:hypothetical protein
MKDLANQKPGLPDGIFSYQIPQFWYIWESSGMKKFDMTICYN